MNRRSHPRTVNMKKALAVPLLLLLPPVGVDASEPRSYEMPRTHVVPIKDSKSDRQYELYIRLPDGYSENTDMNYPAIYTTDAVWHLEMLSGTTEYLMPDVILVGISWQKNHEVDEEFASRFRDYTVVEFSNPEHQAKYQGGQAPSHLRFIRSDVIKHIEHNYRADPGERSYFGYSLGGQFGAYVLLAQPDTFKHYILGSPAFGQRSLEHISELEARMAPQQQEMNTDVFVSVGELEEGEIGDIEDFVSVLERRSQAGLRLAGLETIEGSDHGTAFPEAVVRGIRWLSQLESD